MLFDIHKVTHTLFAMGVCPLLVACGELSTRDSASPCGPSSGVVKRIIDGDTVEMEGGTRIRYLLIDTPELGRNSGPDECFAQEATEYNQQLVLGKTVELEYDVECQDRYGRTLAYLYVGDNMVNELLVHGGYATVLVIPPNGKYAERFYEVEQSAKDRSAGLWGACS